MSKKFKTKYQKLEEAYEKLFDAYDHMESAYSYRTKALNGGEFQKKLYDVKSDVEYQLAKLRRDESLLMLRKKTK